MVLASWTTLAVVVLSGTVTYAAVILLTRLTGVRSLAKMSSFDFAATVAIGSTVSATLVGSAPLAAASWGWHCSSACSTRSRCCAVGDCCSAWWTTRRSCSWRGRGCWRTTCGTRAVSHEELWAQLRLAGVQRRDQVQAVVMETTGDVSVLRAGDPLDPELLRGVRGAEALR